MGVRMNMKNRLFNFASVLAVLSFPAALSAGEKPSGLLGVDSVSLGYSYYTDDYSHYDDGKSHWRGVGVEANKALLAGGRIGLDANLRCYHVENESDTDQYSSFQNTVRAGVVAYLPGRVRPFAGGYVYYHHLDTTYRDGSEDSSWNAWCMEARLGVEALLADGLSAQVYVAENHNTGAAYPKNTALFGAQGTWWIAGRWGLTLGQTYTRFDHVTAWTSFGAVQYRF
jgi:hypothetical protein